VAEFCTKVKGKLGRGHLIEEWGQKRQYLDCVWKDLVGILGVWWKWGSPFHSSKVKYKDLELQTAWLTQKISRSIVVAAKGRGGGWQQKGGVE
jgi:hypothetical protein